MYIAIVDDVEADRLELERILKEYGALHQMDMACHHYASGEAFLQDYQPYRFAVVFLDIFMDGMTGIETAERIRAEDEDTALIFLTTSEEHRPEAFSLFATSYLIKPCAPEQVYRVMDHILRVRTELDSRFLFSYERKGYSLRYADIVSVETDRNYLTITDREGKTYRTRMTFSMAESQLDGRFLTLLKGIAVNMDHILKMSEELCYMKGGAVFPLHVKRARELKEQWLNYKFAKIREQAAEGGG